MPAVPLPPGVLAMAARGPDWAAYVDRLPRLLRDFVGEWSLEVDGVPTHGSASLVVPVRRDGEPAVLKIAFADEESEHEALGLQRWGGDGAVRLLRADPHRRALLLERLGHVPGATDLDSLPALDACEVVAGLHPRLHVPAPPQLRPVTTYLGRWTPQLRALPRDAPIPRRLVEQTLALVEDLLVDDGAGVMLHGDLHYQNVLAAERQPWLVIDPKPMRGDRHYEPAPMLWNRWEEAVATGNLRAALRRRFHAIVDGAGLDEDLARDWVVVRMVYNALWELEGHPDAPDRDWLTTCVAVAKAVQE